MRHFSSALLVVGLGWSSFLAAQNTVLIASTASANSPPLTSLSDRPLSLAPAAIPAVPLTATAVLPSIFVPNYPLPPNRTVPVRHKGSSAISGAKWRACGFETYLAIPFGTSAPSLEGRQGICQTHRRAKWLKLLEEFRMVDRSVKGVE
jgi:hypothetical protein